MALFRANVRVKTSSQTGTHNDSELGEKDIMYESINSTAASLKAGELVGGKRAARSMMVAPVVSSTVENSFGRRTELERASSGNLH